MVASAAPTVGMARVASGLASPSSWVFLAFAALWSPCTDNTVVSSLLIRRGWLAVSPFEPSASAVWSVCSPSICSSSPPLTSWSFSEDALRMFWYSCEDTADTIEPTATPITDPAMPILADSRNEVTAASAPATSCGTEIPLKKFFTLLTVSKKAGTRWAWAEKSRHAHNADACRKRQMYRLSRCAVVPSRRIHGATSAQVRSTAGLFVRAYGNNKPGDFQRHLDTFSIVRRTRCTGRPSGSCVLGHGRDADQFGSLLGGGRTACHRAAWRHVQRRGTTACARPVHPASAPDCAGVHSRACGPRYTALRNHRLCD